MAAQFSLKERFQTAPAPRGGTYAALTIGAPQYTHAADAECFKKTAAEKAIAREVKKDWENQMRAAYGENWRKEKNPPGQIH